VGYGAHRGCVVVDREGSSQGQCRWVEGVKQLEWVDGDRSQGYIWRVKGAHIGSAGVEGVSQCQCTWDKGVHMGSLEGSHHRYLTTSSALQ